MKTVKKQRKKEIIMNESRKEGREKGREGGRKGQDRLTSPSVECRGQCALTAAGSPWRVRGRLSLVQVEVCGGLSSSW